MMMMTGLCVSDEELDVNGVLFVLLGGFSVPVMVCGRSGVEVKVLVGIECRNKI